MKPTVDIYDFDNYRDYLSSIFKERQEKNPRYSMRKFSRDLGFSSPNHVTDIIKGEKKLGRLGAEKILSGIALKKEKESYFRLLVQLAHCRSPDERLSMQERFRALQQKPMAYVDRDKYTYYKKNRMCAIICSLIDIYPKDFSSDPVWIMRRCRRKTSVFEVSSALVFMIRNGFIAIEKSRYVNKVSEICCKEDGLNSGIQADVQRSLLAETSEILSSSPEKCEFINATYAISQRDLMDLQKRCQRFFVETNTWLSGREKDESKDLGVTVSLQLYQVCGED